MRNSTNKPTDLADLTDLTNSANSSNRVNSLFDPVISSNSETTTAYTTFQENYELYQLTELPHLNQLEPIMPPTVQPTVQPATLAHQNLVPVASINPKYMNSADYVYLFGPIIDWLIESAKTNTFHNSVLSYWRSHDNHITVKQHAALVSSYNNYLGNSTIQNIQDSIPECAYTLINWNYLLEKFQIAISKGIRYPKMNFIATAETTQLPLSAKKVRYKISSNHSRPGWYSLLINNEYAGAISKTGTVNNTNPDLPALDEILGNLDHAATAFGQLTGSCCVCGRELTNAESIAANIGPVCAVNYGFH